MKITEKEPDFEKALKRLETIVQEMETGAPSLDKMVKNFEEGMGLIRVCTEKLNEVERKIEVLVKKNEALATAPFEPDMPSEAES